MMVMHHCETVLPNVSVFQCSVVVLCLFQTAAQFFQVFHFLLQILVVSQFGLATISQQGMILDILI